mmetsp:Transcript_38028/g.107421  ORF Transcript_38028/g.107421 Transcript_38028/m.107421 type:complete len:279 (+) Transcript_38028:160-996(+)
MRWQHSTRRDRGLERERRGVQRRAEASRSFRLPVGHVLHPAARVGADDALAHLIIDEDEHRPGNAREPVQHVQGASAEGDVEEGQVHQKQAKDGLKHQTEVHELVAHALLKDGELAGLGDEQIGPLYHDDGDEVGGLSVPQSVGLVFDVGEQLVPAIPPEERASRGRGAGASGKAIAHGGAVSLRREAEGFRARTRTDLGKHSLVGRCEPGGASQVALVGSVPGAVAVAHGVDGGVHVIAKLGGVHSTEAVLGVLGEGVVEAGGGDLAAVGAGAAFQG